MRSAGIISGIVVQSFEAEWRPLRAAVGAQLSDQFAWVCEIYLVDGTRLDLYRHCDSQRHLHLSGDGRAFVYVPGETMLCADGYRQVPLREAIHHVLGVALQRAGTLT
jgi:hypothetical protein